MKSGISLAQRKNNNKREKGLGHTSGEVLLASSAPAQLSLRNLHFQFVTGPSLKATGCFGVCYLSGYCVDWEVCSPHTWA